MSQEPSTPTEFLRKVLLERTHANPSYSLRAMARDLAISHAYLSQVLNNKKEISLRKGAQFAEQLKLDSHSKEFFLRLISDNSLKLYSSSRKGKTRMKDDNYYLLELDRFKVITQWYHLAILELTLLKQFKSDADWIAKEIKISPQNAKKAMQRLVRLGLLTIKDGKLLKTHEHLAIPSSPSAPVALRKFHKQMSLMAIEALRSAKPADSKRRDITGMSIPIDPTRLPEAKRRITKFRRRLSSFLYHKGQSTELYHLNVQFFPLSKRESFE